MTEAPMDWIPIAERLPEKSDYYLVSVRGYNPDKSEKIEFYVEETYFWSDIKEFVRKNGRPVYGKINAWMDLPTPYRPPEEKK